MFIGKGRLLGVLWHEDFNFGMYGKWKDMSVKFVDQGHRSKVKIPSSNNIPYMIISIACLLSPRLQDAKEATKEYNSKGMQLFSE